MNELALFAGAGGGILGGKLLGWTTVCAVEIDEFARRVLLHRQQLGHLPRFPIWDDICTFDGKPWRGLVDVVSGGFPCQDISAAGKGAGLAGARSGLWREMHRIICEVRPRFAFVENSPMLISRGLSTVLGDLAAAGYDAAWIVLGADDVGAPHVRKRIWILARDTHADGVQCAERGREYARAEGSAGCGEDGVESGGDVENAASDRLEAHRVQRSSIGPPQREESPAEPCGASAGDAADADVPGRKEQWRESADGTQHATAECGGWWSFEPRVGRVAHGVASRVDRLRCLGNGQVPLVAATAFRVLEKHLEAN